MSSKRLTRRRFIVAGAASAVGVGVAGVPLEAAGGGGGDLIVGRFVRAEGPRVGVVSVDGGKSVSVALDAGAFVAHGADGITDTLFSFVPGEPVVARGGIARGEVAAVEFQSIYTSVSGTYTSDAGGHSLVTSSGQRVRVPDSVLRRDAAGGIARGERRKATIWTNPATGEATAVDLP